jgi:hypothetical protein
MRWLPVYNAGLAVVCAATVMVAAGDSGAGARADHWTREAEARRQLVLRERARDQEAVARYTTLAASYDALVSRVQRHQKQLAAEIDATRKLRRKVVTGATIVSYVPAGKAP